MTKIKLCGLSRPCDIECANFLLPEYIGFVFAKGSRRFVSFEDAEALRMMTDKRISVVGVFRNEAPEAVARLAHSGVIDMVQLHGNEDKEYIIKLRAMTKVPIIKAFNIKAQEDVKNAENCSADYILFDSAKAGSGRSFDRALIKNVKREYFLAGGLDPSNVESEIEALSPYAVDVSSGIESNGVKDEEKMRRFVYAVRNTGNER